MVNQEGIHVDPSKVESVKNWKTPESPTKIRSFLGLRHWIEQLSDYECEIKYHLSKANVVADALSRKESFKPRPVWIPSVGGIRKLIMDKAYTSRYLVHLGADKMYYDLRDLYWWPGMKRDIAEYVRKCLTCSKIKAEHRKPLGFLQQQEFPEWNWEKITMDLVTKRLQKRLFKLRKGKTARSHQKSYADKRRKLLDIKVKDRVLLKVSPWKGFVQFRRKGKLAPRYVGPFKIVECVGRVAYQLKLPQELSCIHDTFHVSNFKKCLAESDAQVPLEEIKIDENLHFVEEPIEIVERDVKKLKRRRIPLVKVHWNSRQGAEYTWEREDQFKTKYPHIFASTSSVVASSTLGTIVPLGGSTVRIRNFSNYASLLKVPAKRSRKLVDNDKKATKMASLLSLMALLGSCGGYPILVSSFRIHNTSVIPFAIPHNSASSL
uniref:Putative reverse transcriptase domain-containing protein n=1 Tax=Tanacetum cinerariifolium TaxID=118510 RepID=A0A6L2L3U4_TANCI|nr:putative reverse transcriptase domain-containing protein [Tanacetum cinerariifolium]